MVSDRIDPRKRRLGSATTTALVVAAALATIFVWSRTQEHAHPPAHAATTGSAPDVMAEAQALHVVANLLGLPLEPEEAKACCVGIAGCTALDRLAGAAGSLKGLEVVPRESLPDEPLGDGEIVAVLRADGRPLVLRSPVTSLEGAGPDGAAPTGPLVDLFVEAMPAQQVRIGALDLADAKACVKFRRVPPTRGGETPCATFTRTLCDVGLVAAMEPLEVRFPLTNTGATPLTLQVVESSRGLRAVVDPASLPPGSSGVCTLAVGTAGSRGPFVHHALLATSDPRIPKVRLIAQGTAFNTAVLMDERGIFPPTRQGATSTCELRMKDPGDGSLAIEGIELGSAVPPLLARSLRIATQPLKIRGEHYILTLELTAATDAPLGEWTAPAALLLTTSRGERSRRELFLEGTLLPEVIAQPAALCFRLPATPQELVRSVTVTRPSGRPLAVANVRVPEGLPLERSVEPDPRGGTQRIGLRLRPDGSETPLAEGTYKVELLLDSGECVVLPVLIGREDRR